MNVQTDFSISETASRGIPILSISGEADVVTAPQIRDALFAIVERSPTVVVDLSELSFVDSTALGVLVSGVKRLRNAGGDLRLVVTQPRITKVFEITGLTKVFSIFGSVDQAVTS